MSDSDKIRKPHEKPAQNPRQKAIGASIMNWGRFLMFSMFILFLIDYSALAALNWVQVPLYVYLTGIFTGVAMQFIGAAVPNMKFTPAK